MEAVEQNLIQKCQAGELNYFGGLYDTYIERIYRFVFYRTHDKEITEDITSQVFIKALENIKKFKLTNGNFSAWLYRIARNTIIDYWRTKKEHANVDDFWSLSSDENIDGQTADKYDLEQIKKYMQGFSAEQREILVMRIWDGLSYAEIATISGKKEGAVKMSVKRSLTKIQQNFGMGAIVTLLLFK